MYEHGTPREEQRAHQAMCVREILLEIVKELEGSGKADFKSYAVTDAILNLHRCHFDILIQLFVDACSVQGIGAPELRTLSHDAVHKYLNAP